MSPDFAALHLGLLNPEPNATGVDEDDEELDNQKMTLKEVVFDSEETLSHTTHLETMRRSHMYFSQWPDQVKRTIFVPRGKDQYPLRLLC